MLFLIKEEIFFIFWDVLEFWIKFVNFLINIEFFVWFVKKICVVGKRFKDNKYNDFEGVLKFLMIIVLFCICRVDFLLGGVVLDR